MSAHLPVDAPCPAPPPWNDVSLSAEQRVAALLERMTLPEKAAQLYGVWVGADPEGGGVAPHMHDNLPAEVDWEALIPLGLGQLTRPFGTAPVDPALGAQALARAQRQITAANRFAIPATAHEECLAGFAAWGATCYPVPLAWGASFDPDLVAEMAAAIGRDLRKVGVHQGLAPVLDVVRDPRWGRVEETIGEDPCLVGTIGSAYVRGLEAAGVVATLKHFVGYSASTGARNLAPARIGQRELADVLLPPFELALREGGARSVMHSYAEIDGVPAAADPRLLTELLRGRWGFAGTVVADYFGIAFLQTLHKVAADVPEAAVLALTAGVDVELPTVHAYGTELVTAVEAGLVAEELVDRAARRVLLQKCELGLLDADWDPQPAPGPVDLDPPGNRELAARLAEESVVLLANPHGLLPLAAGPRRIAVVGPLADDPAAMLGCYSFPMHVGPHHPGTPMGIEVPTLLEALRAEFTGSTVTYAAGCTVAGEETEDFAAAVRAATDAEVCVAVLGDRAGLFGRGTSGEGCDAADLRLPGRQSELLDALLETGTPVILVLLAGRPYALGDYSDRLAATIVAFFPGEEGAGAVTGVLSGRVCPSGRLPVSVPHGPGGQPWTYLQPPLGLAGEASSLDPTPLYPFGHGLSYTSFAWEPEPIAPGADETTAHVAVEVAVVVRNTGARTGTEVVQLYLHDPVAQVTRPDMRLVGYARIPLAPGESARAVFRFDAELAGFCGTAGHRIVEPGELELRLAASSGAVRHTWKLRVVGEERRLDGVRMLRCPVRIEPRP
ncbi:glycoside hydrolase family 3 N-terminal domain-containing protein [Streptomyces sp. BPTC-684]|uniref:beta-xylosidase/alpha-l-arabinosidase n=1 Tax=Streptomyces sp. BPTC-684 TaxID=3043734 RepID=UPI0024B12D57|nr:glycoside hydrolase family 3 N-terminal domain-containing protein [Streptomyces sp. BPTC-684]WHM40746.1 glycoside hydrolase family 3 N-terminal domain-containing protein [Streptomyces sp. BPTC-684]